MTGYQYGSSRGTDVRRLIDESRALQEHNKELRHEVVTLRRKAYTPKHLERIEAQARPPYISTLTPEQMAERHGDPEWGAYHRAQLKAELHEFDNYRLAMKRRQQIARNKENAK